MSARKKLQTLAGFGALLLIVVATGHLGPEHLRIASLVSASAAFLACLAFVIRYHVSTAGAWAHSAVGRNIMLLMASLVAALGLILAVYIFGEYPYRRSVAIAVFLTVAYAAVRRLVLQTQAQSPMPAPRPDSQRRRRSGDRAAKRAPNEVS